MKNKGDFKKGNQLWQLVDPDKIGRPSIFKEPIDLWNECVKYFKFQDDNPIITEENITADNGNSSKQKIHKKPYTWEGLYVFLGVYDITHYKTKSEFSQIIKTISDIIYNQKFEGASIGIFNSNLIARDLGIKDQQDITTNGENINNSIQVEIIKPNED